jgi:hypothetical protein
VAWIAGIQMKLRKNKQIKLTEDSGQTQATDRIDHAFASSGLSDGGYRFKPKTRDKQPKSAPPKPVPQPARAAPKKPRFTMLNSRKRPLFFGLAIVIAVTAGVVYFGKEEEKAPVVTGGCGNDILQEAVNELTPDRIEQLHEVVHKIEKISDYQQDPNCLYVITHFYINVSDAKAASDSLSKLEQVYNADEGYHQALKTARAKSLEVLRADVAFLNEQASRTYGPDGSPL